MSASNSNATERTRADFLADLGALIGLLGAGWKTQRPIDRAFVTQVGNDLDCVLAKWRERAPRTCESVDCDVIVTEPMDALCPSCKAGGTPSRHEIIYEGTAVSLLAKSLSDQRKQALAHRVFSILRDTLQVRHPTHDTDDVRVDFTDASLRVLAPLIEAVDILEAIIWASDGCVGHRDCAHSTEPWQRARTLLRAQVWQADCERGVSWPNPTADADKGK